MAPRLGTDQLTLFATDAPALDASFRTAIRTELDATSWVEHVPGWLSGSEALLHELVAMPGWEQRQRWMFDGRVDEPRLTVTYPSLAASPVALLVDVAAALSAHYGVAYDGLWMNLYRDERDSTAWHGDRPSCRRSECIVPVLSLGATRRFLLKPKDGGRSLAFTPAGGDLIVMGGRCQRDWRHCVPKQTRPAGARVSVNFQSTEQMLPDRG